MLLNIIILFWAYKLAISAEYCTNPAGQYGDCKSILRCPPLMTLLGSGRSVSPATARFLRQSQCGTEGSIPKVCCPIESGTLRNNGSRGSKKLLPEVCGNTAGSKIFGGTVAELDEFPWMALLKYQTKGKRVFLCGGTLISKRYVVTAKHCIKNNLMSVRLGEHDTRTDPDCLRTRFGTFCNDKALTVDIEEIVSHPDSDIALLRLKQNVPFTDFIKPICLPFAIDDRKYLGKNLVVSGWGRTEQRGVSPIKRKVQVPVQSFSACQYPWETIFVKNIDDRLICAGGEEGKDSCNGDSGGPLMGTSLDKNGIPLSYIFGVVSKGPRVCGRKGQGAMYVRVSKYLDWILENLKP